MAAELKLRVDENVYQLAIDKLAEYMTQLANLKAEYETKRAEIGEIWQDEEAEKYYETIDRNIKNVEEAWKATDKQRYELQKLMENKQFAKQAIDTAVDAAKAMADALF